MRDDIEKRCLMLAHYIISHKSTVRKAGLEFHISKSTVHKDVTERLYDIDRKLYQQVQVILAINLQERHIRGGLATQTKYNSLHNNNA